MSESNADIKKLEDRVAELVRENQSLATQLKERDGQAVKAEIDGLKNEVTTREQKVQVLEAKVEELAKSVAALTKRAEDADAAKANVEGELATLKAEKVQQSRLALLTSKGASSEKAAELLQKFQRFSDEEFASIVDTLAVAWKAPAQTTTPVRKTPEQVIDNTANNTPHDPALAASEPNEEEKAQARIAKASRLFTKNFLHHSVVSDKE